MNYCVVLCGQVVLCVAVRADVHSHVFVCAFVLYCVMVCVLCFCAFCVCAGGGVLCVVLFTKVCVCCL